MANNEQNQDTENLELSSYGERTYDGREDHKSADQSEQTAPISGVVDALKSAVSGDDSDSKAQADK
jgi:hypothetical protein